MFLFVVAATLFPTVAHAESTDARLALRDYTQCIVAKQPDIARRVVIEDWEATRLTNDKSQILSSKCMMRGIFRTQLRAQGPIMKFAIAEALWRKDRMALDAAKLTALPRLTYRMPPPVATHYPESGKPLPPKALAAEQGGHDGWLSGVALAQFGECVVRASPSEAMAVLQTSIGKPDELAAIRLLNDPMAQCLNRGQTVGFNRVSVRGSIAAAAYRLSMAVRGVTWVGDAPQPKRSAS